ncbi:MAG: hypothetical protein QXV83_01080 [Candidatus Anstonellaceae archaeon]
MKIKKLSEFIKKVLKKNVNFSSYDVVGTIAILDIPPQLEDNKLQIAKFLLSNNKHIKTVAIREQGRTKKFRIKKIKVILGQKTTQTINVESGARFFVDLNKVYYNPRFSEERLRIAKKVKDSETVIVMFSGIAPYPIIIEKKANPKKIVAIELNKTAHKFALKNVEMNKCKKIELINGDVKEELAKKKYRNFADRIILPHPTEAENFLNLAIRCAKNKAMIHLYTFKKKDETFEEIIKKINQKIKKINRKILTKIEEKRIVRPFSKELSQIVLDIKIKKPNEKS